MSNPYYIEGPALISFSGGRSSGFMLKQIIDAHGGKLPDDVHVVFANTGKEMPETLDFVLECESEWDTPITWLEYHPDRERKVNIVSYDTASRNGEPLAAMMATQNFNPTSHRRICTQKCKIEIIDRYMKFILGVKNYDSVIGLRADEMRRVVNMRSKQNAAKGDFFLPMADAGVSAMDVKMFWDQQHFDLNLMNVNGKSPEGNCDLCFLKGKATLLGLVRQNPELADWWIEQEKLSHERNLARSKENGKTYKSNLSWFRDDMPYSKMKEIALSQMDLFDMPDEPTIPCTCTD